MAFVEEILVPQGFAVKTNQKVYGEDGVQTAEFDVEIEGKVGSTHIRWLIECRDRPASGAAPAAWIEQLVGRRERFRFNKVTAVSTTGFTAEANKYATQVGIELRQVTAVSPDQFKDWLQLPHMTFAVRLHNLQHANVLIDPSEPKERQEAALNLLKTLGGTDAFLRSSATGKISTAREAFLGALNLCPQAWDGVLPNTPPRRLRFQCVYDNDADHFVMDTAAGVVRVQSIVYEGELSIQESDVPPEATCYSTLEETEAIAEIATFSGNAGTAKLSIEFRRIPESARTHVFLRRT